MLRLILTVDNQELSTDIYFKSQATAEMWIKHHYLIVSVLVYVLKQTRDFQLHTRRTA